MPVSWLEVDEEPLAAVGRWARQGDEIEKRLDRCVVHAAAGSWDERGLHEPEPAVARADATSRLADELY